MLTDGRTDKRTNGRKLARLCLPAKAGATKMREYIFKSRSTFGKLSSSREANRKSQKLFPIVKMAGKCGGYPYTFKLYGYTLCLAPFTMEKIFCNFLFVCMNAA